MFYVLKLLNDEVDAGERAPEDKRIRPEFGRPGTAV